MRNLYIVLFILSLFPAEGQCQEVCEIIAAPDDSLADVELLTIPSLGIGAVKGNRICFLENNGQIDEIALSDNHTIEDIIVVGADILFKNGQSIYLYNRSANETPLMSFDTDSFHLAPCNMETFYLYSHSDDRSRLYLCNIETAETVLLLDFEEYIHAVFGDAERSFIVSDNHIYVASPDDFYCALDFSEPIISAIATQYGVLFATEHQTDLLVGRNEFVPLGDFGCRQMLYDEDNAYLMTTENYLLKLDLSQIFSER